MLTSKLWNEQSMSITGSFYIQHQTLLNNTRIAHTTETTKKVALAHTRYNFFRNCNGFSTVLYMGNDFCTDFFKKNRCESLCSVWGPLTSEQNREEHPVEHEGHYYTEHRVAAHLITSSRRYSECSTHVNIDDDDASLCVRQHTWLHHHGDTVNALHM